MPLDFVESSKQAAPVDFFITDTKARPQHLETEVLPELIRRVGDVKSGRIACWMVQRYLEQNVLLFDPLILTDMFKEADYRKEGSLDSQALAAAVLGRYPKRQLTREWRQLLSLLLGVPELVLTQDIRNPKVAKNGVFGADSIWTQDPPALPPIPVKRVKSAECKRDFQKPVAYGSSSSMAATRGTSVPGVGLSGSLTGTTPPAGAKDTVLTIAGLRSNSSIAAEQALNQAVNAGDGAVPRFTFDGEEKFSEFNQGLETTAQLGLGPAAAAGLLAGGVSPWTVQRPHALRAWSASLPPKGITISSTALNTLRSTVKSTAKVKPEFQATHRTLSPSQVDLKKTLGQQMDVSEALNRVEPTRPTNMRFEADFRQWGDSAKGCRTAPSAWYNEHPSLPAAAREPTKYPWGEWGLKD